MTLDDAEKERRKKARMAKKAETLRLKSEAREEEDLAEIASVWEHVHESHRRAFNFIAKEIASGTRDPGDVAYLRETREIHFRQYRKHIPSDRSTSHD